MVAAARNGDVGAATTLLSWPGLKVLFITGYAENAVIGNGLLEPRTRVLTTPFAVETHRY